MAHYVDFGRSRETRYEHHRRPEHHRHDNRRYERPSIFRHHGPRPEPQSESNHKSFWNTFGGKALKWGGLLGGAGTLGFFMGKAGGIGPFFKGIFGKKEHDDKKPGNVIVNGDTSKNIGSPEIDRHEHHKD